MEEYAPLDPVQRATLLALNATIKRLIATEVNHTELFRLYASVISTLQNLFPEEDLDPQSPAYQEWAEKARGTRELIKVFSSQISNLTPKLETGHEHLEAAQAGLESYLSGSGTADTGYDPGADD